MMRVGNGIPASDLLAKAAELAQELCRRQDWEVKQRKYTLMKRRQRKAKSERYRLETKE